MFPYSLAVAIGVVLGIVIAPRAPSLQAALQSAARGVAQALVLADPQAVPAKAALALQGTWHAQDTAAQFGAIMGMATIIFRAARMVH